jgi:hypothetical protein
VWAVRIPNGSAHVNLALGTGSLHIQNLDVFDAFTVPNSLAGVNRTVNLVSGVLNTLRIEWSGINAVETANESVNQMRGTFVEGIARIAVTATTPRTMVTPLSNGQGFRFESDPASTSISHFALIGEEQNGIYY